MLYALRPPHFSHSGMLGDYTKQAQGYDTTRAASPSVLAPLRSALRGAPGSRLLDAGGGTGNYALALRAEGWRPLVLDRSAAMLRHAAAKGLPTVLGDATALPFDDESYDAVMLVSMLHHVSEPTRALDEARRVVGRGGRVAAMVFTYEDIVDQWYRRYFPSADAWMFPTHPRAADLLRHLPGATTAAVHFTDIVDGSMAALLAHPHLLLDAQNRANTSFFERMARDHGDELDRGLAQLAADIANGKAPQSPGGATMIAWAKPA